MAASGVVNKSVIETVLAEARERIAQLEVQQDAIRLALAAAKEEEQLLLRLLALRQSPKEVTEFRSDERPGRADVTLNGASTENVSKCHPVTDEVARELANTGRPIHISELMRLLNERNVPIPGAGTQANLIAHLRRDIRFVRPSRGMYALAAWGLENMPITSKRSRRKRRAKSTD